MRRLAIKVTMLSAAAALSLAACGAADNGSSSQPASTDTSGGSSSAAATSSAASTAPPAAATVKSSTIAGRTLLVAAANSMTLYQFAKDVAGSGSSACVGACIAKWPALTVPAGAAPSAPGIPGQWGTIARSDGGGTQVTYNGLPLYFFSGDSKPGDANGNYPNWSSVTVSGSGAAAASSSVPATASGY